MGDEFYLGHVEFEVRMWGSGETKSRWKGLIRVYTSHISGLELRRRLGDIKSYMWQMKI